MNEMFDFLRFALGVLLGFSFAVPFIFKEFKWKKKYFELMDEKQENE